MKPTPAGYELEPLEQAVSSDFTGAAGRGRQLP